MDYLNIQNKLRRGNLADTFTPIRQKAAEMGHWELTEETERLWMTYQQMLQFMLQGMHDAQSERIRTDICRQLVLVTARLERLERLKTHPEEKYVSVSKEVSKAPSFDSLVSQLESVSQEMDDIANDELLRDSIREHRMASLSEEHETALRHLFNRTWTGEVWRHADVDQANRLLFSDSIRANDKAVFVSAVTLSLFEVIDEAKLLFLMDCYLVEDTSVSQRALIGLALMLGLRYEAISGSKALKDRLDIYSDDAAFVHDLYAVLMQLHMSCTTDRVTSKMRNDIMPALMKRMMERKKDSGKTEEKTLNSEAFVEHGENPEWIADEKTDKKVHEMAEMQLDGADVYYATFSMMKGHPFFQQMPHWFYPFSLTHASVPEVKSIASGKTNKFIKMILNGSPFCNSDKYSFCFTFSGLGNMAENAIETQINSQIPDGMSLDDLEECEELQKPKKADIRRHYVFDLYRFYHNFPYKQQFFNPFVALKEHPVTPFSNPWLQTLLANDQEELAQYADFLMRKEFYQAALDIFTTLAVNEFDPALASIWQKVGFCHQKLNHTAETIHAYTVANSIKPNSKWTLSHLASLCQSSGQSEAAAKYYQELLKISPESLKYLTNAAQSLMQCEQYEEALPLLYKASFLDEDSSQVKQQLAWCLMVSGKKDEAMKFVLELQAEDSVRVEAGILFGLVLLMDGRMQEAHEQLCAVITDRNRADVRHKLHTLCRHQLLERTTLTLFTDALMLMTHA